MSGSARRPSPCRADRRHVTLSVTKHPRVHGVDWEILRFAQDDMGKAQDDMGGAQSDAHGAQSDTHGVPTQTLTGPIAGRATRHYSTSGASEMIFMKFFSRSSRATGPKMRVPRGLLPASMSTAAFSSNAISVPSSRPKGFFVRTTTAFTTSPFLTVPCGAAVLTVAVMMSPTRA